MTTSSESVEAPTAPEELVHDPVMVHEVLDLLECAPGGMFADCTLGLGGHAAAILERIQPGGLLLGIDRDRESLEQARVRLAAFGDSLRFAHENFKNLPLVLNHLALPPLDGILADLGVSSYQLLDPERGFSFQSDAPLDMRMDRSQRQTAADLVNDLSQEELAAVIYRFGEERFSRRIAGSIVRARGRSRIVRCSQLAEIVASAVPRRGRDLIHPATRTFQALRIAVNRELDGLEKFLAESLPFLRPGGRLVVISFHSLEDRIVKQTFRMLAGQCVCRQPRELCTCPREQLARILTPRPLTATPLEVAANKRSRSARLRAVERTRPLAEPIEQRS
jgi:16S rRNA (cytosine1402-N4)-methyltransferase